MRFDDWPPKPYTGPPPTLDLVDEIFAGSAAVATPAPQPPVEPAADSDALPPTLEEVVASRLEAGKAPRPSRSRPRPSLSLRWPARPPASAAPSNAQLDPMRSVLGLAAGVLVWVTVLTWADVTAGGAMVVSATAAAVVSLVAFARGWRTAVVFAGCAAIVSLAAAHWWWVGAALVLVLASVIESGWKRP